MSDETERLIDRIIDRIVTHEGGFVDHTADRGGPTKYGITAATLARWRGVPEDEVSVDDIRRLSLEEARAILRRLYIEDPRIDRLPSHLIEPMADTAVLMGPRRAVRMLQMALSRMGYEIAVDGIIGPQTAHVAAIASPRMARRLLIVERIGHHIDRIRASPDQYVFARGWIARALDLMDQA